MNFRTLTAGTLTLSTLVGCQLLNAAAPTPAGTGSSPTPAASTTTQVATSSVSTTTYMYVFNALGKTVDEVNLSTMAATTSILTTGSAPNWWVTEGAATYLVNSMDNNIYKYDLRAHQKLDTINVLNGTAPQTLTMLGNGRGLVANFPFGGSKEIAWYNLNAKTFEATASVDRMAYSTGIEVVGGKAYVPLADPSYGTPSYSGIDVFDATTHARIKTIDLPVTAGPRRIVTDPNGKLDLATSTGVIILDPTTDTVAHTIDLGAEVTSIRFLSATKAYGQVVGGLVSFNPTTGAVLRANANKIAAHTDPWATGTFRIFGNVAYVANYASNSIQVIDLLTETASGSEVPVGNAPQDMTFITVNN